MRTQFCQIDVERLDAGNLVEILSASVFGKTSGDGCPDTNGQRQPAPAARLGRETGWEAVERGPRRSAVGKGNTL